MKVIDRLSRAFGIISGICVAIILGIMCAELIARNVFSSPILGANEICTSLYVVAAYLGFAFTQ